MAFSLPYTLVAGTAENVNNVQSMFGAIKDELNQATTTSQTVVDAAASASTYKLLRTDAAAFAGGGLAGTHVPSTAGAWQLTANGAAATAFYWDPADFTVGGRTNYWRLRATVLTNATAPAVTFTVGLYPISAVAGTAGVQTLTLGTVTAGSTVAFTTQAASTRGQGNSGDFAAPAAGYYIAGVASSGTTAANSLTSISTALQYRQV